MTRDIFLKKAFQAGLLAILGFVAYALKDRTTLKKSCSSCPEQAQCPGKRLCDK
jgi:hypothetical protein